MKKKHQIDYKTNNAGAVRKLAREERLAHVLRSNLQKRKDQARRRRSKDELVRNESAPKSRRHNFDSVACILMLP